MTIFDFIAGVKLGFLEQVRKLENETRNGVRKILCVCHSAGQINRGFKQRGISRDGFRHIVYRGDSRQYLEEIGQLFY